MRSQTAETKASIACGYQASSANFRGTFLDTTTSQQHPPPYVTLSRRPVKEEQKQVVGKELRCSPQDYWKQRPADPSSVRSSQAFASIRSLFSPEHQLYDSLRRNCVHSSARIQKASQSVSTNSRLCSSVGDLCEAENSKSSGVGQQSTATAGISITSSCWRRSRKNSNTISAGSSYDHRESAEDTYYQRSKITRRTVEIRKSSLLPPKMPQLANNAASSSKCAEKKVHLKQPKSTTHSFMSRFFATSDKQRRREEEKARTAQHHSPGEKLSSENPVHTIRKQTMSQEIPDRRRSTPVPTCTDPLSQSNDQNVILDAESIDTTLPNQHSQNQPYSTSSLGRYASKLKQQLSPFVLNKDSMTKDHTSKTEAEKDRPLSSEHQNPALGSTPNQLSTSLKTLAQLSVKKRDVKLGSGSENDLRADSQHDVDSIKDDYAGSFRSSAGASSVVISNSNPAPSDSYPVSTSQGLEEEINKKGKSVISSANAFASAQQRHPAKTTDPNSNNSSSISKQSLAGKIGRGIIHEFASSSERLMSWKAKLKKTKFDSATGADSLVDDELQVDDPVHMEQGPQFVDGSSVNSDPLPARQPKYLYKTNSVDSNYDMAIGAYYEEPTEQNGHQWAMGQRRPSLGGRPDGFYVGLTLVNNGALETTEVAKLADTGGLYFSNAAAPDEERKYKTENTMDDEKKQLGARQHIASFLDHQQQAQDQSSPNINRRTNVVEQSNSSSNPTPPTPRRIVCVAKNSSSIASSDSNTTAVNSRGGNSQRSIRIVPSYFPHVQHESLENANSDDTTNKHYEEIDLASLHWKSQDMHKSAFQQSGVYNVQQHHQPVPGFYQKNVSFGDDPSSNHNSYANDDMNLPPPSRITPYSGVPQAKDGEIVRPIAFRPVAIAAPTVNSIRSHSIPNSGDFTKQTHRHSSPSTELSNSNYDNTHANNEYPTKQLSAFTPPSMRRVNNLSILSPGDQQQASLEEDDRTSNCSRNRETHSMTPGRVVVTANSQQPSSWHQNQQIRIAQPPPPPPQRPQPISYQEYCRQNHHSKSKNQNEYDMISDIGPPPARSNYPTTPTGNRSFDYNGQQKKSQPVPPVRTTASLTTGHHQQQQMGTENVVSVIGGGSQNYGSLGSRNSSGIHVTPSPSDSGVAELELALREKENELIHLRQTMEHNEQAIVRVYQEKELRWQEKLREWAMRLDHAVATEQRFLSEVDQLQNERADLQNRVQTLAAEKQGLQRKCKELESEMFAVKARLDERRQTNWIVCKQCGQVLTFESRSAVASATTPDEDMISSRDSHHLPDPPFPPSTQSPRIRYRRTTSPHQSLDELASMAAASSDHALRSEVDSLKSEVSGLRQSLHDQVSAFNAERRRWEIEKQRVLQYQKLLEDAYQMNCVHHDQKSTHSTPTGTLKAKDFNVNPYAYGTLQHAPSPYHNLTGNNQLNLVHSEPELEV